MIEKARVDPMVNIAQRRRRADAHGYKIGRGGNHGDALLNVR